MKTAEDLVFHPAEGLLAQLDLLHVEQAGAIVHLRLNRPAKRNAISDTLITQLHTAFVNLPEPTRAVVLSGEGEHFCAGLDLAELMERDVGEGVLHSRMWHAAFDQIQFGRVLASACHLRVAEASAYFGLPEGQRGLFVGGGGSVRVPRLMGVARMTDMMLTGRVYDRDEGVQAGLAQYAVADGEGFAKATLLAQRVASNAPMSNFAVMHALPRIADQSQDQGLFTESLMAAVAESTPDAKERLRAFLDGRANKVTKA
jgi:enoyl-CoA hydratase/carnithine racemase